MILKTFVKRIYILVVLALFTLVACSKQDAANSNEVIYRVSLEAQWSAETHPNAYPNDASISSFVAFSHADYIELFNEESLATPGLKALAEKGSINPLDQEIQDLIDAESAYDLVTSTRVMSPGFTSNELKINALNPTISLVAQISPSPDWFAAIKDVNLYENGEWVDRILPLVIYDAGTVLGSDFYAPETPRTTPVAVSKLTEGPLATPTLIGVVRLERIN